ncbi:MAG TPA: riboflavin synthase [bacterium]|nr:riboflavin synthase [bacterium]HPN31851.1 riboflavin synthase [bacterium]
MFTGIIEETGLVAKLINKSGKIELIIKNEKISGAVKNGDSVSVNGVCLTATETIGGLMKFDIMTETIKKTALIDLKINETVNLERAVLANGRLDGHYVTGHIDCVLKIISKSVVNGSVIIEFNIPPEYNKYIAPRGSVAIDGISLTVAEKKKNAFKVSLVKFTQANTSLIKKKTGDKANVEFDILGKYLYEFYVSEKKGYGKY